MTRSRKLISTLMITLFIALSGTAKAGNPFGGLVEQIGNGRKGLVIHTPKVTIPGVPDVTKPIRHVGQNAQRELRNAERQIYEARQRLQRELENARRRVKELTRIESNRNQVQASLKQGWYYAPGKEIDYVEYQNFLLAVSSSVALSNPGPVQLYLNYMLVQMKAELSKNLKGEARRFLEDFEMTIVRALQQVLTTRRPVNISFGGIDFQVGVASYSHWKKISGHYPEIYGNRIKWTYAERTIRMPNTHQPYVRFRVRYGIR